MESNMSPPGDINSSQPEAGKLTTFSNFLFFIPLYSIYLILNIYDLLLNPGSE